MGYKKFELEGGGTKYYPTTDGKALTCDCAFCGASLVARKKVFVVRDVRTGSSEDVLLCSARCVAFATVPKLITEEDYEKLEDKTACSKSGFAASIINKHKVNGWIINGLTLEITHYISRGEPNIKRYSNNHERNVAKNQRTKLNKLRKGGLIC